LEDEILEECAKLEEKDEQYISHALLLENSPHSLDVTVMLICCYVVRFHLPDKAISHT
jgi:hypothetical protein